jgi:peptidoglycan hydrolase-like protein with peptidoglycan-binding domain
MAGDQVIAFRAGRAELAQRPAALAPAAEAMDAAKAAGTRTLLADISEFQPDIADAKYLAWSRAIVIRAAYGTRADAAWYGGARRADLLAGGAQFLGIYQYVTSAQDPATQARALLSILGGKLNKGEIVIADIEEGAGNQAGRRDAWRSVIQAGTGFAPWVYSGLYFASSHGIAPVEWVAAYQAAEPAPPHKIWQFTDAYSVPGVGVCDCSVFNGSITALAALAYQGTPAPEPPPVPPPAVPAFPYPAADYLGLESNNPHCHSGFYAADRPHISTWQAQMSYRGWTISADGRYGAQSDGVCRAFQQEKHLLVDGKVGLTTWAQSWASPVT